MRSLGQDLRYALRQLLGNFSFTATALLSLACGIAATTAVFSVVWAVVVQPYPYANPDRMAHLALGDLAASGQYRGFATTVPQWQQLRTVPAIEDSILTRQENLTVTGGDLPEDVQACFMTSNGFHFFGVPAALGRGLQPSDAVGSRQPQPVVVLGYTFWQRRYQGNPGVIGKTIELARNPYTIVGVAARRFTWNDADVYLPMQLTAASDPNTVEIRLRPGVSHKVAAEQMQPLIHEFERQTPLYFPPDPGPLHVIGLNEQFVKALGPTLAVLFGAVALLLAIGCANVSILLLARGTARQHEFALRAAIGASRTRIVRQLLTESLLLSLTGASLGAGLSYSLVSLIRSLLPEYAFPHEAAIQISLPALTFCVVIALVTGILFGLSPALRLSRPDVRDAMQGGSRRIAGSRAGRTTHHLLIGTQIALTLVLLTTSMLAISAFLRLARTPPGYDPHNVMSVGIPLRTSAYATLEKRAALIEVLRDKISTLRGVQSVAVSSNATPPNNGFSTQVEIPGASGTTRQLVRMNLVSPEYFSLLRIPLLQGRLWTESENHNGAKLCVVNSAFARHYFPHSDPIGHSLRAPQMFAAHPPQVVTAPGADGSLLIVGVVADKLDQGLDKPVDPEAFVPFTLGIGGFTQMLVRTQGPPLALLHAIGVSVASVDRDQQIAGNVRDLEQWITTQQEYAQGQLISWLFGAFAALALLLAAVGLYSVVSCTVAQRTNEFGIRIALGAKRADVLRLVLQSSAISVTVGALIGIVASLAAGRALSHIVTSGRTSNLLPLLLGMLVLGVSALIASVIPARRATRIEPLEALRYE
ncbi:MAG TPA: ADOP family duplicated permease [Acidobacteriaceae bacterium]|nr:ADOP family duplicated permease [Acidobacteriaceae bacterium]